MGETFHVLPDGKRIVVYDTEFHPDISGNVQIQTFLLSDIPSYTVTGDNITPENNTNLLSVYNNISTGERIRIQEISAYPLATANNSVALQVGYIGSFPSGGTNAVFTEMAADYPPNQTEPNGVIAHVKPDSPNPVSGRIFGGNIVNLNSTNLSEKVILFQKSANKSSIHLRAGQDGITVRQVAGGNTGAVAIEVDFVIG